jgi:hypothetical protein
MVNEDEIFYLTVTSTTMGSGTTSADATVLFDGGDIGLNNNQKKMRSLTIIEEIQATPNADPVVTLPSGPINYTESDPATVLDSAATLVDPDSTNFDGGLLRVDLGATGTFDDRLAIRNEGTAAGQIGISGSDVTYGGVVIGTFAGGTDGSDPLTVSFNSNADVNSVQAVLRNITYENVSSDPSLNQRAPEFTLSDGDAGVSNPVVKVIVVNDVNTAPVLAGANDLEVRRTSPLPGSWRPMPFPSCASSPTRTGTVPSRTESPSTAGTRRVARTATSSIRPARRPFSISSAAFRGAITTALPHGPQIGSSSTTMARPQVGTCASRTTSCVSTTWTEAPRRA